MHVCMLVCYQSIVLGKREKKHTCIHYLIHAFMYVDVITRLCLFQEPRGGRGRSTEPRGRLVREGVKALAVIILG
jgi:hypothetical protein